MQACEPAHHVVGLARTASRLLLLGGSYATRMTLLLWTMLPPPWRYGALIAPVAGFFAWRWLWPRRRA